MNIVFSVHIMLHNRLQKFKYLNFELLKFLTLDIIFLHARNTLLVQKDNIMLIINKPLKIHIAQF